LEKMGDPVRIEATIVTGGPDGDGQGMGRTGLEEAVETRRPHGAVRDRARFEPEMHWQRMLRGHHAVLKVTMAKKVGVPIGIVAPGRRRVAVEALVIASPDALDSAVAGGTPLGTGASRQGGAVAAEDERLEVAQYPTLDRGEDSTGAQEVFQAGEQLLGARLVSRSQQCLGQALGDGIGRCGLLGLRGVPGRLFLLQMPPMAPLAVLTGPDAVRAGWGIRPIFQPVNKVVEGAHGGRLAGGEASDLRQAGMGAEVPGPLRQTWRVEEEPQEEGTQHTDGITGWASAGAGGIKGAQQRPGRIESESQEDQGGVPPGLWEATSLVAPPALELGGQGRALVGMR
jgi:hypothetical protein